MKPVSIKDYRKKEVRRLNKERRQLYQKHFDLGYRKLEKPIRHGWYKELVILPQIERYKFKPEIEEIVKKLDRYVWGRTKEEAQKKWDKLQSNHLIFRNIPTLSPKSYRKLSEKAKRHCTAFTFIVDKKRYHRYYVRIPKHAFKVKYKRAYTTHSKIIDPNIMERLDLIEQQLNKPGWYGVTPDGSFSYKCRWNVDNTKKKRKQTKSTLLKYKNASLREAQNELKWERN